MAEGSAKVPVLVGHVKITFVPAKRIVGHGALALVDSIERPSAVP